jgi:hypothetical protein
MIEKKIEGRWKEGEGKEKGMKEEEGRKGCGEKKEK